MPVAAPHIRSGRLKLLAVTEDKRAAVFPDAPTVAESGVPGYAMATWYGMVVPTGTPREAVALLNREIARILALPDIKERFAGLGADTTGGSPEQFGALHPSRSGEVRQGGGRFQHEGRMSDAHRGHARRRHRAGNHRGGAARAEGGRRASSALGLRFKTRRRRHGELPPHGTTLPDAALEAATAADGVILGPCGMTDYPPREEGGINVPGTMRKRLDLYANLRPARSRAGLPRCARRARLPDRAREHRRLLRRPQHVPRQRRVHADRGRRAVGAQDHAPGLAAHRAGRVRVRDAAPQAGRPRSASATCCRCRDGIFIERRPRVGAGSPAVELREMDIDAMAADLYTRPERHDVILITNMFGDILSNLAVAMSGGLGLAAALNAGDEHAVANAGHGSAPDIAGKDIANPDRPHSFVRRCCSTGSACGTARTLRSCGERAPSTRGRSRARRPGRRAPRDLGGRGNTRAFAEKVAREVQAG